MYSPMSERLYKALHSMGEDRYKHKIHPPMGECRIIAYTPMSEVGNIAQTPVGEHTNMAQIT